MSEANRVLQDIRKPAPRLDWSFRASLALPAALIASAQLGVPAAVVTLGLQEKLLSAAQGAAIITAALGSLAIAAFGTALLARATREKPAGTTAGVAAERPTPAAAADG